MTKASKELYFKKIGELTQKEFELLFNISTDINDASFRKILEPIAEHSISDINIKEYKINELNYTTAYLLGSMQALKQELPETYILALFGESGCGKSHLIHLVSRLQQMNSKIITEADRVALGLDPKQYEKDDLIRSLKEMADSISIIQKKTTRPSRDGKQDKPEIQEGMSIEEVQKCDWTYTKSGNLYGMFKEDIDEGLKKGHVMAIVNESDLTIMKNLNKAYPVNFLSLQIFRTTNEKEWISLMKKDKRTREEIEKRKSEFGVSIEMYEKLWDIGIPEVILNLPGHGDSNMNLLLQLQGVIARHEKRIYSKQEREI